MLNVVALNLALLSRASSSGQPSRADLELAARSGDVMRRELKRLDSYIDNVLRAHASDDEGWQRLDLGACSQRVGQLIAARAARQRVTVRLNIPDDEVFVNACPAQLQNALLNLAVNALDAMPNGGTLDLQVSADGPMARFRSSTRVRPLRRRAVRSVGTATDHGRPRRRPRRHQGRHRCPRRPHRLPSREQRPGACFTTEFTRLTVR